MKSLFIIGGMIWVLAGLALPDARAYADAQKKNLALFVFGHPGTPQFENFFEDARQELSRVLEANGFSPKQQAVLSQKPGAGTDYLFWDVSNRKTLESRLASLGREQYDDLFIFIAGHANGRDEEAVLHLPGKDIRYDELMPLFKQLKAKRRLLVAAVPQAHVWVEPFSGDHSMVLAGNNQREYDFIPIQFLINFPLMFEKLARWQAAQAEEPVTQHVSLADVFFVTSKTIGIWYERNALLATERPVMEADGDGHASAIYAETSVETKESSQRKQHWLDEASPASRLQFVIPWVGGSQV